MLRFPAGIISKRIPAVAAYESGSKTPNLATLERLLGACDHDVELLARPRVRRGAASLAELAQTIGEDLKQDNERDALRLLRFVEPWWFVASRPEFNAYTLANSPAVMVRHGVFMAREVFDRA